MSLTGKQLRDLERALHIAAGVILLAIVFTPLGDAIIGQGAARCRTDAGRLRDPDVAARTGHPPHARRQGHAPAGPDGGTLMADHAGHLAQDSDENLGYLLNRTARLMAQSMGQRLRRHGVQLGQWAVLLFLYERDGQSQAELARVVAIEQPTMVRTIDRMVRDGLVTREADPTDRRVTRIRLTDKARALQDALYAASIDGNRVAASALSPAERNQLVDYLHRIIDTLLPIVSEGNGASVRHSSLDRGIADQAKKRP